MSPKKSEKARLLEQAIKMTRGAIARANEYRLESNDDGHEIKEAIHELKDALDCLLSRRHDID